MLNLSFFVNFFTPSLPHWYGGFGSGIAAYRKPGNTVSSDFIEGLNSKNRVIQRWYLRPKRRRISSLKNSDLYVSGDIKMRKLPTHFHNDPTIQSYRNFYFISAGYRMTKTNVVCPCNIFRFFVRFSMWLRAWLTCQTITAKSMPPCNQRHNSPGSQQILFYKTSGEYQ